MPQTKESSTSNDEGDVYDVIVIGAGLAGLSAAYNLKIKKKDLKILILEGQGNSLINWC